VEGQFIILTGILLFPLLIGAFISILTKHHILLSYGLSEPDFGQCEPNGLVNILPHSASPCRTERALCHRSADRMTFVYRGVN
jgi:hypothetical protein